MRRTDEIKAYATYFRLRQGENQSIKDYLKIHQENRQEVVRARRGVDLDLETDSMEFLEGFHSTILKSFKSNYASAYKNQPYTWPIILAVVDMMEDEKPSDAKATVGSKHMGTAIDGRIQQVAAEAVAMALNSSARGSRSSYSARKEHTPSFPCPACGSTNRLEVSTITRTCAVRGISNSAYAMMGHHSSQSARRNNVVSK